MDLFDIIIQVNI